MKNYDQKRRSFLKNATKASGMMMMMPMFAGARTMKSSESLQTTAVTPNRIKFAVININHSHIYGMTNAVIRGGGELVGVYAKEADLLAGFKKAFPNCPVAKDEKSLLEDKSIQLILSSGIPDERAALGIRVMQHGKDYLTDKPGIITLEELAQVKKVQKETKRIYMIMYSERLENKATTKAGELVKQGAIGQVIQTVNLAPHRIGLMNRPDWFFDKKRYGGIITDIGSHQFDQYLYFTGTTQAEILSSQIGNVHYPQYPKFEDFGDITLRGNGGAGYIRVDWFTPDGLDTWGDGRLTILGTEGYIEVRKNTDILSGHKGGNHLYMANKKDMIYMDCNNEELPFGRLLVDDIINRTETAMPQAHCFLATELALLAQKNAKVLTLKK
jgi:predicted dehydrogenase